MPEFTVRAYQRPFFSAWTGIGPGGGAVPTKNRLIEIAHRRWGKDELALRAALIKSQQRPASYWHCLPLYEQGRKALWTAINPHTGQRRIEEAFPNECIESRNEQEMFIRFKWGATWQIVGSDRYNALVGSGVAGVTFSEWALANPQAWGYIRPMVQENNGWAAFITTPRGNNHAKAMLDMARANPDEWFSEISDIRATGALTPQQLADALEEYIAMYGEAFGRAIFEQEYFCSFASATIGAYWAGEVDKADREGRIWDFPIDPDHPVHTAWDLGKAANNPIWCFQVINGIPRIVDFYQPESDDLNDWCKWLDDQGYNGIDYVPHDIIATEWGSTRTRLEILQACGRHPKRLPMVAVADGLQAGRETINCAMFRDTPRVKDGIEGLRNYRRDWDDDRKTFREIPVKDWSEHIGSAFRYLSLGWRTDAKVAKKPPKPLDLVFEVDENGKMTANMDVKQAVEAMVKRRRSLGA